LSERRGADEATASDGTTNGGGTKGSRRAFRGSNGEKLAARRSSAPCGGGGPCAGPAVPWRDVIGGEPHPLRSRLFCSPQTKSTAQLRSYCRNEIPRRKFASRPGQPCRFSLPAASPRARLCRRRATSWPPSPTRPSAAVALQSDSVREGERRHDLAVSRAALTSYPEMRDRDGRSLPGVGTRRGTRNATQSRDGDGGYKLAGMRYLGLPVSARRPGLPAP